jgi:hypothetical protein
MPTINIAPKAMQNGDNVTVYKDTVGPQQQTYTFLTSQERVILKNSGSKNITYTVGSQSGSLGPSQSIDVKETISSINLTAEQGTQQFEIWADEVGSVGGANVDLSSITTQLADIASINLKNQYGLKTGKTLYYDSVTNKHWYDQTFTQSPQPIADILNQAFIDYKGKDTFLFIPEGYYLIDKPLTLQDGVGLVGVPGKTKFIVDDTFANGGGDYIVTNTVGANVYIDGISIEYKGFKTPCFSDPADVPNGKEGMMIKMTTTSSCVIKNSYFIAKNNGIKTRVTAIWLRDGYNSAEISNNYIEHTSSGISTGCLWFMCNTGATGQNVKVHDNTIIHTCKDEPIGIWGDGTHQDYEIYNNVISIPTDSYNTQIARLIAIFSNDTGTFKNIKVHNNNIKLYGLVQHIFSVSASQATFTNILFENNSVVEYASDATNNILLDVFYATATYNDANYQALYQRSEVVARRNSYVSKSTGGRRAFAYAQSAFLKLIENVVSGYFGYGMIYDQYTSSYSKIVSIGNDYNYSSLNNYPAWKATTKYNVGDTVIANSKVYQCTAAGTSGSTSPNVTSGTATDGTVTWTYLSASLLCTLGTLAGNYLNIKFSGDKIANSGNLIMFNATNNTNITDITVENCIIAGTGWDLFYLYSNGNANSRLNFINNTIGETYNALFYAPDTFTVSVGTATFKGNKFLNALASMSYADNVSNSVVANSTISVYSNTYKNGETDNLAKTAPTNANIFKLFETGRVMLNIGSGTNRCWTKQADGSWLSS